MKKLITMVEDYLGPKLSGVAVAAMTAAGQISSALGVSDGDLSITDILINAAQTDLVSFLPAPIAGIAAMLLRKTTPPSEFGSARVIKPTQDSVTNNKILETNAALVVAENNIKMLHKGLDNHLTSSVNRMNDLEKRHNNLVDTFEGLEERTKQAESVREANFVAALKRVDGLQEQMSGFADDVIERVNGYDTMGLASRIDKLADRIEALDEDGLEFKEAILELEDMLGSNTAVVAEPLPLNLRQNNPGNIESTLPGGNRWNGEMDSTNRYAVFESPAYGVRAMMYLLKKVYYQRHELLSVDAIIHRWAPLGDNSPESVNNYIQHVARDLHIQSTVQLTMTDEQLVAMVKSMAEFEGGRPLPYTKEVYSKALELLG